ANKPAERARALALAPKLQRAYDDFDRRDYAGGITRLLVALPELVLLFAGAAVVNDSPQEVLTKLGAQDEAAARDALLRANDALQSLIRETLPRGDGGDLAKYESLFVTIPLPAVARTFQQDEVFADMRVAGPNPMVLRRLSAPSPQFPADDPQV